MNKQRHRQRSQDGTSPETTPQTGSGVAHFSVSEVVQFSMSVDIASVQREIRDPQNPGPVLLQEHHLLCRAM